MELFFKHILYFLPIGYVHNMIRRKAINRLMNPIETRRTELSSFPLEMKHLISTLPTLVFSLRLPPFLNWKEEKKLEVFEISHLLFLGHQVWRG